MKKMKWVIGIIAATVVFAGVIWIIATSINPQGDENVQAYKKALDESMSGEFYHYTRKERVSTADGGWHEEAEREYYKCGSDILSLEYYTSDKYYFLNYKNYNYQARISEGDNYISKIDHGLALNNMHNMSYYSIYDKYVTYEETDTQFIVIYENKSLIGKTLNSYKEEELSGYKSAVSVAYFDKDWNIQRIEFKETWDSLSAEGIEYERIREVAYEYHDTSKEEIQKIMEAEYNYLNSLLEE